MLDPWTRTGEPTKPGLARAALRPGDPDWRRRWLAAVRRRLQAPSGGQQRMRAARLAALAADQSLWAEVRAAEAAYARGEGERFIPGTQPRDGTDL